MIVGLWFGDLQVLFLQKIKRQESDDKIWHAIHTQVQITHVTNDLPETSPQALAVTGLRLPEWGFGQFEVVASDQHSAFTVSLWNVEEHRYTKGNIRFPVHPKLLSST